MRASQLRQRPRSSTHETIGMLSRALISAPHSVQLERGFDTDMRSGTRAATTLTKLPKARAGGSTSAASATFTLALSAFRRPWLSGFGPLPDGARHHPGPYGVTSRNSVIV